MKKFTKLLCCCLVLCLVMTFALSLAACSKSPVKNLIYIIGDGMGFNHIENAKVYMGRDKLAFEDYYVGDVTTHSADEEITDSSASATALATGVKTNNHFVGIDPNEKVLKNVMELSKARGKRTAIVTTDTLDGGTPASFSAHDDDRDDTTDIIKSQAVGKVDLLIGKHSSYYQNNKKHFVNNGFTFVDSLEALTALESGKIVGNIPNVANYDPDATDKVSLKTLVEYALDYLTKDNKKGFTLMVEGAYIDKYSHVSDMDIMYMIYALMELNETVDYILDWASKRDDTAIIFTADHETGGLQLAANKDALSDSLYTATYHTAAKVPVYLYNITTDKTTFDNTDLFQLAKQIIKN